MISKLLLTLLVLNLSMKLAHSGCCYTIESLTKTCENPEDCTGDRTCNGQGYCEGDANCDSPALEKC